MGRNNKKNFHECENIVKSVFAKYYKWIENILKNVYEKQPEALLVQNIDTSSQFLQEI